MVSPDFRINVNKREATLSVFFTRQMPTDVTHVSVSQSKRGKCFILNLEKQDDGDEFHRKLQKDSRSGLNRIFNPQFLLADGTIKKGIYQLIKTGNPYHWRLKRVE